MSKLAKILSGIGAAAVVASVVPYYVKKDPETGAFEIGGLLWSLKKTPGEEKDSYALEILPMLNKKAGCAGDSEEEPVIAPEVVEEIVDKAEDAGEAVKEAAEEVAEKIEDKIEEVKENFEAE